MAKMSKKQAALLEAAEEYTPLEEYDLPGPVESETQPADTDCASRLLKQSQHKYTTESVSCQVTSDGDAPTLSDLQARVAELAAAQARTLVTDLHNAKVRLAGAEKQAREAGEGDEQTIAHLSERVDGIHQTADKMADQAIAALGDDAQEMLDQIQAAEEAELAAAQAKLEGTKTQAQATREAREVALAEAQARGQGLEAKLTALVAVSPAAAQVVAEARRVEALVAEADAFVATGEHKVSDLERLAKQLARYAPSYSWAAEVLVDLQTYADAWYADQLRTEVMALEPGPHFDKKLAEIVTRAKSTGVEHLIQGAIADARKRDRKALAEKGRQARLFAQGLAETSNVRPGDVVAHRAGRVTVYRPLNGKGNGKHYRIALAYFLKGHKWQQIKSTRPAIVSHIHDRRRIVVS